MLIKDRGGGLLWTSLSWSTRASLFFTGPVKGISKGALPQHRPHKDLHKIRRTQVAPTFITVAPGDAQRNRKTSQRGEQFPRGISMDPKRELLRKIAPALIQVKHSLIWADSNNRTFYSARKQTKMLFLFAVSMYKSHHCCQTGNMFDRVLHLLLGYLDQNTTHVVFRRKRQSAVPRHPRVNLTTANEVVFSGGGSLAECCNWENLKEQTHLNLWNCYSDLGVFVQHSHQQIFEIIGHIRTKGDTELKHT